MIIFIYIFSIIQTVGIADFGDKCFEGQITYEINYDPYKEFEHLTPEWIKENIGSKVILTYKKGNYKKEYYSPEGELLSERYLDLRGQKSYSRGIGNDTINWVDITISGTKIDFTVLDDTINQGYTCKVIESIARVPVKRLGGEIVTVGSTVYYATDLPVNPKWFKNYKEANFNEVIQVAKGHPEETFSRGIYWERHEKMKAVEWREVKKEEISFKSKEEYVFVEL